MTKRTKRIYNGTDADMVMTSHTIKSMFEEDIAVFYAFDNSMDASFVAEWQSKLEELSDIFSDHNRRKNLATLTHTIKGTMLECREMYKAINYFASRAFMGNTAAIMEFGRGSYPAARSNQVRMMELMQILHSITTKEEAALLAQGMPVNTVALILALKEKLSDQNLEQEGLKNNRRVVTERRIRTLNDCYSYIKTVMDAAKVIFCNDYANYNRYLFSKGKKKKAAQENGEDSVIKE